MKRALVLVLLVIGCSEVGTPTAPVVRERNTVDLLGGEMPPVYSETGKIIVPKEARTTPEIRVGGGPMMR